MTSLATSTTPAIECKKVAHWLANILEPYSHDELKNSSMYITESQLFSFESALSALLQQRYTNHWYPHEPIRGSAYRCLSLSKNGRVEPVIQEAAARAGVKHIAAILPKIEASIFVDPHLVSCRREDTQHTVEIYKGYALNQELATSPPSPPPSPTRSLLFVVQNRSIVMSNSNSNVDEAGATVQPTQLYRQRTKFDNGESQQRSEISVV